MMIASASEEPADSFRAQIQRFLVIHAENDVSFLNTSSGRRGVRVINAPYKFDNRSRACRPNSVSRWRKLIHGQERTARVSRMNCLMHLSGVLVWQREA